MWVGIQADILLVSFVGLKADPHDSSIRRVRLRTEGLSTALSPTLVFCRSGFSPTVGLKADLHSTCRAAIQHTELHRFGHVRGFDAGLSREIGDGARDLEDAMRGARA
jgi:hypothetical protein